MGLIEAKVLFFIYLCNRQRLTVKLLFPIVSVERQEVISSDSMSVIKDFFERIRPYLNKYVITLILFGILLVFVDENNLIRRFRYDHQIRELRREIRNLRKEREESARQLEDLRIGTQEIEKIAREQYLMKRDNEDVYILEKK